MFRGLCAFPITPADASGQVDVSAVRRLVAPLCAAGVNSIGLLGSTGLYPFLSRAERRRALDAGLEEAAGRVPVLVGIGALRTDDAVRIAQDAKAGGAAAGLLATVSYTPLTDEEAFEHFVTVARESGLPICIYDNPGTTHFKFSPALVGRLSHVPGIVAVETPSPDREAAAHLAELRRVVPEGFSLGYSVDALSVEPMIAGGDCWYSVFGGVFPQVALAIVHAAQDGDIDKARRLDARLQPLWDLFREFSSLRVAYACNALLGTCYAEPPRPILSLADPAKHRVADTLKKLRLF